MLDKTFLIALGLNKIQSYSLAQGPNSSYLAVVRFDQAYLRLLVPYAKR